MSQRDQHVQFQMYIHAESNYFLTLGFKKCLEFENNKVDMTTSITPESTVFAEGLLAQLKKGFAVCLNQ